MNSKLSQCISSSSPSISDGDIAPSSKHCFYLSSIAHIILDEVELNFIRLANVKVVSLDDFSGYFLYVHNKIGFMLSTLFGLFYRSMTEKVFLLFEKLIQLLIQLSWLMSRLVDQEYSKNNIFLRKWWLSSKD